MASHYGTAFEQLEDEDRTAVSKKPKAIQDEIVTDERGKRRFHGAFTGGFSAGYWNTVGSKHGWVPQTFKSSRESRAEKTDDAAENYMDEEDLGEFGIAAKKLRTKSDFMESFSQPGEKNLLAWERSSVVPSTSAADDSSLITSKLSELLRPTNDSVGVRLLKKMGWREGKGIGPRMSRRALERQKVLDAASRGEVAEFDEETVTEMETHVPDVEFAPDDVPALFFNSKENSHGLGYNPMQEKNVLVQSYGVAAMGLKTSKNGKAIRGQAFGVGAFEDEDEDIYTSYDLSQYDFEIGARQGQGQKESARFDSTFVPAKSTSNTRKFFPGMKPPHAFRPVHKPSDIQVRKLPSKILQLGEKMTPFQRAKFLGERDQSVMELLSEKDRKLLSNVKAARESGANFRELQSSQKASRRNESEPFEEEPIKAHRFKKYVSYLKRGIYFDQPVEMTRLEWEQELAEFQNALTPELRALLPEVRSRQKPLAKIDFAQPIAEQLNSRFQKESDDGDDRVKLTKDHDLYQAVKMKMFGDLTRKKFTWHPHKELCKRFNVPNPYPDAGVVGVAELQKRVKPSMDSFSIMNTGLQTTQQEMESKSQRSQVAQIPEIVSAGTPKPGEAGGKENAPWELLKALFEEEGSTTDDESDDEVKVLDTAAAPNEGLFAAHPMPPSVKNESSDAKAVIIEKVITVLDLVEEDDVFGPALPPSPSSINRPRNIDIQPEPVRERSSSVDRRHKKHSSREKKKKHKESKKHKKKKSKKRRQRSSSFSESGSSVEVLKR